MVRHNENKRKRLLTETEETIDASLVDANFQDMQEQIEAIQAQFLITDTNEATLASVNAYAEMVLFLLDKIYSELL